MVEPNSLPFHDVYFVDTDRGAAPVNTQDNGEGQPNLSRSYTDHKNGKDLPDKLGGGKIHGKGDQVDVDRVQHELDGHNDHHGVAAGQNAVKADAEQYRAQ